MKINKYRIISFISIILIATVAYFNIYYQNPDLKYFQDYVVGEGNIKGNVDCNYFLSKGKEFEIGANKHGYAVFKNPNEAFKKLKNDYTDGLRVIQKEFKLLPISRASCELYGIYGWQVTIGSEEEREQASFISSFMDIYENSFNVQ